MTRLTLCVARCVVVLIDGDAAAICSWLLAPGWAVWRLHVAFDVDALLVRGVGERGVVGVVLVGVGDGEAFE